MDTAVACGLIRRLWPASGSAKVVGKTTSELLAELDLPKTGRWGVLKILHAGYEASMFSRQGKGNYRWALTGIALDLAGVDAIAARVLSEWNKANGTPSKAASRKSDRVVKPVVDAEESRSGEGFKSACRCGGTGFWVNPKNPADKRPCFFCNGDEARRQPGSGNEPDSKTQEDVRALRGTIKALEALISDLSSRVGKSQELKIISPKGEVKVLKAILPKAFQEVLDLAMMRKNIMMVGPAGSGKTSIGALVAEALSLPFSAINCSEDMSASQIIGRDVPNLKTGQSNYVYSEFATRYEQGGIFLLDEVDASNSNVLLAINSALSNGYLPVSKGHIKRHDDFVCIATANTMGHGASRQYVGRNQLDAATLDRFKIGLVEIDYDEDVERSLCPDVELFNLLRGVREAAKSANLRQIISTRFLADAHSMKQGCGWTNRQVMAKLLVGWSEDEKSKVKSVLDRMGA